MLTALVTVAGLYVLAAAVLALSQRQMIYHPTTAPTRVLEAWAQAAGLLPWRNATGQRIGWMHRYPTGPAQGQVLITHGNAGCAVDRAFYVPVLQRVAALDLFILEYPGYGDRPGSPSERALLAAAEEALGCLASDQPVYLLGESLGSGVAAYLAGRHPERIAGVLLIAPFDNLTHLAQHHMPLLPVRWLLKDRYPSDRHLAGYRGPVAVLLAGRDEVVPTRFGRRLYDGYAGPKKLWESPQARHNEVYDQPARFWGEVISFWRQHSVGLGQ
jgi:pimeloyl-ACP methyl ester carboxylesterase